MWEETGRLGGRPISFNLPSLLASRSVGFWRSFLIEDEGGTYTSSTSVNDTDTHQYFTTLCNHHQIQTEKEKCTYYKPFFSFKHRFLWHHILSVSILSTNVIMVVSPQRALVRNHTIRLHSIPAPQRLAILGRRPHTQSFIYAQL